MISQVTCNVQTSPTRDDETCRIDGGSVHEGADYINIGSSVQ